jgi:hypothetical protein
MEGPRVRHWHGAISSGLGQRSVSAATEATRAIKAVRASGGISLRTRLDLILLLGSLSRSLASCNRGTLLKYVALSSNKLFSSL